MKKINSLLLVAMIVISFAVLPTAATYTDVPEGSSLSVEVEKASNYGLMNGVGNGAFGYNQAMTRAQFAAVLVRMMGWTAQTSTVPSFRDVLSTDYWFGTIETAVSHGVVDAGGSFRPDTAITREEMSVMLVRALGLKAVAKPAERYVLPFSDVSSNRGYISVAYAIGMTKGMTSTTFAPKDTATRAQAAAMLVRIYEKLHQKTNWVHGFYAISSYNQVSLSDSMNALSAGWSRMTWDGSAARLSTSNENKNEFSIPDGYESVTACLDEKRVPLHLNVFMDTSGGLRELLASPVGRDQAVEQVMNELSISYKAIGKNPYAGVTIDFEGLRSAQKTDFNSFLTTLSQRVHALGKTLYVCVSPYLATESYFDGYDYRMIGDLADKVILMTYDYDARDLSGYVGTRYYKTTAQAPIDQVFAALKYMTDVNTGVCDPSKIALGFSTKNVAWQIDQNGILVSGTPVYPNNETVHKRLTQSDTELGWSDAYQTPYAVYKTEDGSLYFLWYESSRSLQAKVNMAKLFGVNGVSVWRLGNIPMYTEWNWGDLLN